MQKKIIIGLLFMSTFIKSSAQVDESGAHMRSFCFNLDLAIDSRCPALMFKPETEIRFLNGMFQFKGYVTLTLAAFENPDNKITIRTAGLIGDNIKRPFRAYEYQLGINFWGRLNNDATLKFAKTSGSWTRSWEEPGSRVLQLGAHAGFGGILSKTDGGEELFDWKDKNGNVYDLKNNNLPYGINKYQVYTNTITDYVFLGAHLNTSKKADSERDRTGGGVNTVYSIDLIIPTRVWVGNVYSIADETYTATPQIGDNWKKIGYRFVLDRTYTSLLAVHQKLEFGYMTSFSSSNTRPQSLFFALGVGLSIVPKAGFIEVKEMDY